MRRLFTAIAFVLLLSPEAAAQTAGEQMARTVPTPAEVAAQASFDTSYLLALYMMQLARAGTPPSQSDIDEAARQYLTNGAAVTGVPTSGPGLAYFRNGAAVTGVPSSGPAVAYFQNGAGVFAYDAPRVASSPRETGQPGAEDASVILSPRIEDAAAAAEPAPTVYAPPEASTAAGRQAATLQELQVALAIARQFETAAAPPAAVPSYVPVAAPVTLAARASGEAPAEVPLASAAEPVAWCPPSGPSVASRVALALGSAFLGGLAVVLWSRPRTLRVAHRRR